jgi:hypothetical protein
VKKSHKKFYFKWSGWSAFLMLGPIVQYLRHSESFKESSHERWKLLPTAGSYFCVGRSSEWLRRIRSQLSNIFLQSTSKYGRINCRIDHSVSEWLEEAEEEEEDSIRAISSSNPHQYGRINCRSAHSVSEWLRRRRSAALEQYLPPIHINMAEKTAEVLTLWVNDWGEEEEEEEEEDQH